MSRGALVELRREEGGVERNQKTYQGRELDAGVGRKWDVGGEWDWFAGVGS